MNPFQEKPKKIEKTYESWKGLSPASYDKHETDPYTKVPYHSDERQRNLKRKNFPICFSRNCSNNDYPPRISLC